jgi:hypothetical protein
LAYCGSCSWDPGRRHLLNQFPRLDASTTRDRERSGTPAQTAWGAVVGPCADSGPQRGEKACVNFGLPSCAMPSIRVLCGDCDFVIAGRCWSMPLVGQFLLVAWSGLAVVAADAVRTRRQEPTGPTSSMPMVLRVWPCAAKDTSTAEGLFPFDMPQRLVYAVHSLSGSGNAAMRPMAPNRRERSVREGCPRSSCSAFLPCRPPCRLV